MTTVQASRIAGLMLEGAAAPIGQLAAITPSFVSALEAKLKNTRAAESYGIFKEMCDPAEIYIGFRKNETGADSAGGQSITEGMQSVFSGEAAAVYDGMADGATDADSEGSGYEGSGHDDTGHDDAETVLPDPYLLWLIVPSADGQHAAVEFAEANSATFVYKTGGSFDGFARQLNRALEAISFKREVIRLSDEELRKVENTDYYMAAKRTAALRFIRSCFTGRVIHSSVESWKRKLMELM
jgi:hypothetical protein